ncbi:MAG: glycerol-3-phosphate 1-O-acyltransferase PlsY [Candidatus Riflebacteria bacterium]|nr:glycerol-3-phosphate 1-O-acyltransferase PlsY [Candidatus Riflebacteria bacterium]
MIELNGSLCALLLGYFFGSIPTAFWLAKYAYKKNIFEFGSGNMGATNIYRLLGSTPFAITLALDIIKGFIPILLIGKIFPHPDSLVPLKLVTGTSAVLGHTYSFWVNFRGGKGVATALGVFLGIAPISSISAMLVFIVVLVASGFVSLSSMISACCMPVFIAYFREGGESWYLPLCFFSSIVAVFLVIKHKKNIIQILNGKELSLRAKKTTSEAASDPASEKKS